MKNVMGILFVIFALILGTFFSVYPISIFFNSSRQLQAIENINKELKKNKEKLSFDLIYPEQNWDTVCVVLPYSYERFSSPYSEFQKVFGKNYNRFRIFIPDTNTDVYGVGFSFIKDGDLVKYINIPKFIFSLSVGVARTAFNVDGEEINLSNFVYKTKNISPCLERDKAWFSITKDKNFIIGE